MRILLLASQMPYPVQNGEDLRIFEFVKQLALRHEIHAIVYGGGEALPPNLEKCFKKIHLLDEKAIGKNTRFGFRRVVNAFRPSRMYGFDEQVDGLLNKLLTEDHYDWIWIPAWQMMPYSYGLTKRRVLLDVMDDGVLELLREARCTQSLKQRMVNLKRLLVTYFFERRYFSRVTCCCLVADTDAQVLRRVCPKANVIIVPNGVDSEYFSPLGLPEDYPSLIFEGNMSFGPSADAVAYFCAEIFPLIKAQLPQTKLWIVGRNPTEEVRNLHADQVIVTGSVDDVRPYLDRASVFVCPMRKGAGIKNKILQAWAMAKPVVATSIAAGGLSATPGENIVIADEPRSFAHQVNCLLQNPELRQVLGQRGRETVLRDHTWDRQVQLLENRMKDL
jgi:polysaccharide biosynthesis protein PslH